MRSKEFGHKLFFLWHKISWGVGALFLCLGMAALLVAVGRGGLELAVAGSAAVVSGAVLLGAWQISKIVLHASHRTR